MAAEDSYEAKAFGVKTGTGVREAGILCPGIAIVEAKPPEYIRHHHRIVEAVEDCIHVEAVLSIDEMWAWLPYNLREPGTVEAIGRKIKETVTRDVSPVIKVSSGAGPNKFLAKMASKMRKPDGLFIIDHRDLPEILHPLKLRDLTGIARNMEARLADTMASLDKQKHQRLDATLDKLRARYGRRVVYYGSVQESRADAPMRISFTHIPDLKVEQDRIRSTNLVKCRVPTHLYDK